MEKVLTTKSNKDYLKAIYKVEKKHGGCRNILLVNEMGVSKASVSIAVKKLEQEDRLQLIRAQLSQEKLQI